MNLLSIFVKRKSLKAHDKSASRAPKKNPYHAVQVVPFKNAHCSVVKDFKGKAFLSAEAPRLPLSGCTASVECQCHYKHLKDRRQDLRRDADIGYPPKAVNDERRRIRDRRA